MEGRQGLLFPTPLPPYAYPSGFGGRGRKAKAQYASLWLPVAGLLFPVADQVARCQEASGGPLRNVWLLLPANPQVTALDSISPMHRSVCPTYGHPPARLRPPNSRAHEQERDPSIFLNPELDRIILLRSHQPVTFPYYRNFLLLNPVPGSCRAQGWR